MTRFLGNISVRYKVLAIVLLSFLLIADLTYVKVVELQEKVQAEKDIHTLMQVSVALNNLVHELQQERGVSVGYVGSKGEKFGDELDKEKKTTDAKREELKAILSGFEAAHYGEKYAAFLDAAMQDLEKIDSIRSGVKAMTLPLKDVVGYYTELNAKFLDVTEEVVLLASHREMIEAVSAYANLLQAKERSGLERASGAAGFSSGWTPVLKDKFSGFIKIGDTYMEAFLRFATAEEREFFEGKAKDVAFQDVQKMRDGVLGEVVQAVEPAKWFETITRKINILKEVEDFMAGVVLHDAEEGMKHAIEERDFDIVLLAVAVFAIVILSYIVFSDLIRSIRGTEGIMSALSKGNTDVVISGTDRRDEIGSMAKTIEIFKQGLIDKTRLEAEALKAQARAEEDRRAMMSKLAADFDKDVGGLINSLVSASTELQSTAQSMRSIADETSKVTQNVVASAEEASVNVNTVAAAMEEMSASSREIAEQITNAKVKSNDTANNANRANETVSNLNKLVGNIGEVVIAIQDIAEQTNLLALNATIEAARAGDAGKGFAVVADEVKKLATETATKTGEINSRINQIQLATRESVSAMQKIIQNISEIDHSVSGVSAAVEEQNATTSEISRSISEASQGTRHVSHIILEVQTGANETGVSADNVLEAAGEVAKLGDTLKTSVTKFLDHIR